MNKTLIMTRVVPLLLLFMCTNASSQNSFPKYEGYKPLSTFSRDTVRYLQYNWGINTGGVYTDTRLSEFFKVFELPICDVELRCTSPGGITEVGYIRLWFQPYEKAYKYWMESGSYGSKYSLGVFSIFGEIDKHSMLYEELHPYIPALKKEGVTIVPWKESYKEALGSFLVDAIQYNYGL